MNFLNAVKKNRSLRKIFGERELKIIEKQLLGVRLKASEKTRLSRDIRKKFEAISILIPFVSDFQLKHGAIVKEAINDTKEVILNSKYFPNIRKVVLFGSVVENQLTLSSDIDISVEFIKITKEEAMRFRLDILKNVDERIQIQVYNFLPQKIRKEIDAKGRVLYERKD